MARYTLRVPQPGTVLHGDGDTAIVADTIEQARDLFEDHDGHRPMYLHSSIGHCHVVYKADVENGDCHEDAEPGDTTVTYGADDGRELTATQCRVWQLGAPHVHWSTSPLPHAPFAATDVPEGASVYHRRHGWGQTVAVAQARCGTRAYFDVQFGSGKRLWCAAGLVSVHGSAAWPGPPRQRLLVDGEHVADASTRGGVDALRAIRLDRLRAEWEAAQFDEAALTAAHDAAAPA